MIGRLHLSRLALSLGLVATVVALAAQSALAGDFRSPDTREAATATTVAVTDVRSPDTWEIAARAIAARAAEGSIASDARDAASRGHLPATHVSAPTSVGGFDWGDFGIGIGAALGAILMVALLAALALASRG